MLGHVSRYLFNNAVQNFGKCFFFQMLQYLAPVNQFSSEFIEFAVHFAISYKENAKCGTHNADEFCYLRTDSYHQLRNIFIAKYS